MGEQLTSEPAGVAPRGAFALPMEKFIWPPLPAVTDPEHRWPGEDEPPAGMAPGEPAGGGLWWRWLREAEHAWLGVSAVAWHEGAAMAGWRTDGPEAYCPRCGTSAGPYEADADGCPACRGRRLAWDRAVRLGRYEGVLRDAVLAGKYTAWRRVCAELGRDLGEATAAALELAGVDPGSVVVCPVPTSRRRRLARGVDHTLVMGREVARVTGGRLVRTLRRRHTPPQTGLSPDARRRNVSGAFVTIGTCQVLADRVVVLVDDVRTTGATMSGAARALRGALRAVDGRPAAVWAAVAGVTSRPG